jgi:hypothetical protein
MQNFARQSNSEGVKEVEFTREWKEFVEADCRDFLCKYH